MSFTPEPGQPATEPDAQQPRSEAQDTPESTPQTEVQVPQHAETAQNDPAPEAPATAEPGSAPEEPVAGQPDDAPVTPQAADTGQPDDAPSAPQAPITGQPDDAPSPTQAAEAGNMPAYEPSPEALNPAPNGSPTSHAGFGEPSAEHAAVPGEGLPDASETSAPEGSAPGEGDGTPSAVTAPGEASEADAAGAAGEGVAAADDASAAGEGVAAADDATDGADETAAEDATGDPSSPGKRRKKKKGKGGEAQAEPQPAPKRKGPEPAEVIARIGTTNERAMAYLASPDPKLSRLSRKVVEALLPDLPPVTAAALLGPAGFTRHLVASAAAGRYRDLFVLWETFRLYPAEAKPELAERSVALSKAQEKLKTAVRIGLTGRSLRLAEDVAKAEGLIWQWLREALVSFLPAVGARPAVASALLRREPGLDVPLPSYPDERWLAEAASARQLGPLADRVEAVLGAHVHRLPATVDTLRLATLHFPERVAALVDRVDLDAPDIGAFLAWARDHGAADRLHGRIRERVAGAAARDRVEGLARWYSWQQRGVALELPEALRTDSLEGFDLARPETAELAARLVARGVELDLQGQLETLAGQNRQLAEKAYEAMVCANLDVTLPAALENNPVVNPGTRCPKCRAWTWVRPGHEARCPRPEAPEPAPVLDPFELAAAETASSSEPQG